MSPCTFSLYETYLAGGQRLGGALPLARGERDELVRPRHFSGVAVDEPLGVEPLRLDPSLALRLVEDAETRLDCVGLGDGVGADLRIGQVETYNKEEGNGILTCGD